MTRHAIDPSVESLHGHFSRDLPPILTIDSGDQVRLRTLDGGWSTFDQPDPYATPVKFALRDRERDPGHALCGPIAIRGARAGQALEVRFLEIRPGSWGWNSGGGFATALNTKLGLAEPPEEVFRWALDAERGIGRSQHGREVRLRPFMGVVGMPPDLPGRQSTTPPRACGGNIDCKELIAGSTLFLPIAVDGALFSIGDGHAVQGDGEVGQVALECPMDVEVELVVRDDMRLTMPRANTPAGWITFGFHEDLNEAMPMAVAGMLDLLGELHGVSRKEALALSSLLVDLRITQVVNRVCGVHAVLPHEALGGTR